MSKNSTLKFLDLFLSEESLIDSERLCSDFSKKDLQPRKETLNKILQYSKAVKGIKVKSAGKILLFLN